MMYDQAKILVLDDDITFLEQMPDILGGYGRIDCYPTIDQGLASIETTFYDIAVLDLNFESDRRTGLDVFKQIMALDRGIDVIMITGETDPRRIFELVNSGVRRFIPKPADISEIRSTVVGILEEREQRRRQVAAHSGGVSRSDTSLIGKSQSMQLVREMVSRIVEMGTKDILIQGETGTGKELVAQLIARTASPLKPLLAINCAAVNENLIQSELFGHVRGAFTGADRNKVGLFEAAQGGYVFLDEIGDMPLSQQPKLLRAIQERKISPVGVVEEKAVNFRTISATHKDLRQAVTQDTFREDLYYRISTATIILPPLRERLEDLPELVQHFLIQQSKRCSITDDAMNLLSSYSWPGNVRQLASAVEAMVMRAENGVIRVAQAIQAVPDLAGMSSTKIKLAVTGTFGMQLIARERARFERAIIEAKGDRTEAAKTLGIPRTTFFRKAKELGLVKSRQERSLSGLKQ